MHVLLLIPILYLAISAVYLMVFAIAGHVWKPQKARSTNLYGRFVVMIPAFKEDGVIVESVKAALAQTYPKQFYDVLVIADSMEAETIQTLGDYPVDVLEVSFEKSTKAKALHAAFQRLASDRYDAVAIVDADNIMAPDFIEQSNRQLASGVRVLQGHRRPKNLDSPMARIDALTEEANTHLFRRGHRAVGLPSALTGSGMVFEYPLLKDAIAQSNAIGGFDKEIELLFAKNRVDIEYDENVIVYDEKVADVSMLSRQRSRWMGAQWHYARISFLPALTSGNLAFLNKSWQMLMLPRVLLLMVLSAGTLFSTLMVGGWLALGWATMLLTSISAYMLAAPPNTSAILKKDLTYLPHAAWGYIKGIIHSRTANRSFVHTSHGQAQNIPD